MTYQVRFTDSTNPNKPPITVADGTVNSTSTSLGFVGKTYPNYATIIAEDFLHLLENFAAPTSPANPVQGQLWYDTSTNVLKVFDSTTWTTAGSLKKSSTAPAVNNSSPGDLWANTTTGQLYLFSGSSWLLVGPQFSSGTLTGPNVEAIVDTNNVAHNVTSLYANGNLISVVSSEKFIPKSTLAGFSTINEGVNLSSVDATSSTSPSKFWGISEKADALLVNGVTVPAANFLRSDTPGTTNYSLSVRANSGISIGANLGFNIGIGSTNAATLFASSSGSSINLDITNATTGDQTTLVHVGLPNNRVGIGINNTNPTSSLDVMGVTTIRDDALSGINGELHITGTTDADYTAGTTFTLSNENVKGSIVTYGGLSVGKKSILNGDVTAYGKLYLSLLTENGDVQQGPVILPGSPTASDSAVTLSYDIGSSARRFRNVYADKFQGNFNGTFTGTLEGSASGTAAALASPTVFSLTGDVTSNSISFNGQSETGTAVFATKISSDFIQSQDSATDSLLTDQLLVFRQGTGLLKMTKQSLLKHIALVPVGTILPFAGTVVPTGYLLCDGSEVLISQYSDLYSVIGFTYKAVANLKGSGTFALPDLRGRFPLGADNMNNGNTVPSIDGSGTLISTTLDLNGVNSSSAHRINDVSASIVGSGNSSATGYASLNSSNLPQHTHTLNDGVTQYYVASPPGSPPDSNAVAGYGLPGGSTGSGLPNSGPVSGSTGVAFNVMNPYQTINYIIFTGAL